MLGNFGEVAKGLLTEIPGQPGYIVAIKTLLDVGERTPALKEAALMAQFDNPVRFLINIIFKNSMFISHHSVRRETHRSCDTWRPVARGS